MFSLLYNTERKFLTLCSFVPLHCFLLLYPLFFSFLTVILLIVSENPRAIRSDLLSPCTHLPPHTDARLHPVPHPQQSHTHPAGACWPVSQQALLLHLFFLLPSLLFCLLPSFLAQLTAFPLQLSKPWLPPLLPSAVPAALLALPRSATTYFFTTLPYDGGSSDRFGIRGHPGVRGHGVPSDGAPVCPLPLPSPPAHADNGEPASRQWWWPSSKQRTQDRWDFFYGFVQINLQQIQHKRLLINFKNITFSKISWKKGLLVHCWYQQTENEEVSFISSTLKITFSALCCFLVS